MSMEADKSKSAVILKPKRDNSAVQVLSRCRSRKADDRSLKTVYWRLFPFTPGKFNLVVLFRPLTNWMMPTHITERNHLYPLKY